jgi:hypothetical protein
VFNLIDQLIWLFGGWRLNLLWLGSILGFVAVISLLTRCHG